MSTVYKINKGINRPIEFKGLKAQYIVYLALGLIILFFLFAILYVAGLNAFICLILIGALSVFLFAGVYSLSEKYGQYGLLKKFAKKSLPSALKVRTRKLFIALSVTL